MKKRGIINAQLAGLIAGLGHKDAFMIGDGGMPIPKGWRLWIWRCAAACQLFAR